MARTETNYSDRKIFCRKCHKFILKTALDAQCLILENGLILLNCAFWRCPKCETFGSFVSPILPKEKPTLDTEFPDLQQLERRASTLKEKVKNFTDKSEGNQTDYQPQENAQTA